MTPIAASAAPLYTCPSASSECEGQTFALWVSSIGAGTFDLNISIDTTGYTADAGEGSAESHLASGVEFKNIVTPNATYSDLELVAAPGGIGNWNAFVDQLSQGCDTADSNQDLACVAFKPASGHGYDFTIGEILTWTVRVTTGSTIDWNGGHIKYQYVAVGTDNQGNPKVKQVAGLLSQDITLQDCTNGRCNTVPEPASLLLLGSGVAVAFYRARRVRVNRA